MRPYLLTPLTVVAPFVAFAEPPVAADKVAALVRQLGDDDFQRREDAQTALIRMGEGVLLRVDRLGPQADPEVAERLRRLRRTLVGYRDDIRGLIAAGPEVTDENKPPIADELRKLVAAHQPRSGDFLLSLVADPKAPLHRRAVNTFIHSWEFMSSEQLDAYMRHMLVLEARPREGYPRGIDAAIGMLYSPRHSWGGWPSGDGFPFATRTTHFLDGKSYGAAFRYHGPMATTGWVRTKDLSLGRHTCALVVEYEYTHRGEKHTGRLQSAEFAFTMTSADSPDDLVAPANPDVDRQVRQALRFAQRASEFNREAPAFERPFLLPGEEERRPQITWQGPGGKRSGLAMVLWNVAAPLPVDLCFEVALHEQTTGKVYPCDPLVLTRGKAQAGYFAPRDAVEFARGRSGEVPVKVVLTPSRKTALSTTDINRYFSGSITSGVLHVKVFDGDADAPDPVRK